MRRFCGGCGAVPPIPLCACAPSSGGPRCASRLEGRDVVSAESPILIHSFPVGRRVVTMTIPKPKLRDAISMSVQWSPDYPRQLSEEELAQYRSGRDSAISQVATQLGLEVAVLEL